jgi:hypothetical protein
MNNEVAIPVIAVIFLLMAVLIITENLINWMFRSVPDDAIILPILVWVVRTTIIIGLTLKVL